MHLEVIESCSFVSWTRKRDISQVLHRLNGKKKAMLVVSMHVAVRRLRDIETLQWITALPINLVRHNFSDFFEAT